MRIIGSKHAKLDKIIPLLKMNILNFELMAHLGFYDVFSGIGTVSKEMMKYGKVVVNDHFKPFSLISYHQTFSGQPESHDYFTLNQWIKSVNNYADNPTNKDNTFVRRFVDNYGKKFPVFTQENALRLARMREYIEYLKTENYVSMAHYQYLLGELFVQALNKARIRLAFDWIDTRKQPYLEMPVYLKEAEPLETKGKRCESYCLEANEVVQIMKGGILYLDPPSSNKQHANYYHVLDTLLEQRITKIEQNGKNKEHIKSLVKSKWNMKEKAWDELNRILQGNKADYIVMSYAKKGILTDEQIRTLLARHGDSVTLQVFDLETENLYIVKNIK